MLVYWSLYVEESTFFGKMYYRVSIGIFGTVDGQNPGPAKYNSFPRLEVDIIIYISYTSYTYIYT